MNNKGFTLAEVLITIVIISLLTILVGNIINSSLADTREEAYNMMKKNMITASYTYINECNAKTIECDFSENDNTFYAKELKKYGYFKDLKSPIDGKDIGNCILFKVKIDDSANVIDLEDTCY